MRCISKIGILATLSGLAVLAGCGHGNYVKEGISLAKDRLNAVKAATEHEMGEQALLAGDLDKALEKVDQSIAIAPRVPKNHVLRGRVMLEIGNMGDSLASLRTALDLEEASVDAHYYLGVVYERLRQPENALTHFQRAAELEPFDPQHAIAAGELLIDLERLEEAETFLSEHEASTHSPGVRQLLGHLATFRGDTESAVERMSEARLLAPEDLTLLEELAHAQVNAGHVIEAERSLRRLLEDEARAERRDLKHALARCLVGSGRAAEARSMYRRLTSGDDGRSDAEAWIGLGRTAYVVGDDREMRRAATNVMALTPSRHEGYLLTALWHNDRGETAAALRALEDGIRRSASPGELYGMRALLLARVGRHADARQSLARAQELTAIDPDIAEAIRNGGRRPEVVSVPVP